VEEVRYEGAKVSDSTSVLDVSAVTIVRAARTLAEDVSFTAARGEVLVLRGPSGAGKTTVLRAIAGLDPIAAGRITVDGAAIGPDQTQRARALRELRRHVGMVFQFHHLFEHLTALENVWLAPVHVLRQPRAEAERRAHELLEQMGIGARARARPRELSGGEAQRVAIARALAVGPQVLLMDEPTASLDAERRDSLAGTLRHLAAGGCTLVIASHDEEFIRACSHRVVRMEAGRVI
jgi:ABC-type polar amino acid transport system ATPase subunit